MLRERRDGSPTADEIMARKTTDTAADAEGDNSISRYDQVKGQMARLAEIKEEKKTLTTEANEIIDTLEKASGVNRGALAEIRRMHELSPAAIKAREETRQELYAWFIQPKLDEADAGQADE